MPILDGKQELPSHPDAAPMDSVGKGVDSETGHKGMEVLVRTLGALLVGYLVNQSKALVFYLFISLCAVDKAPDISFVILAIGLFIFNVFRQIHGMAVVVNDKTFIDQNRVAPVADQMVSLLGLLTVMAAPCILAVYIAAALPAEVSKLTLFELMHSQDLSKFVQLKFRPELFLYTYLITALGYVMWDLVGLELFRNDFSGAPQRKTLRYFALLAGPIGCAVLGYNVGGLIGLVLCALFGFILVVLLINSANRVKVGRDLCRVAIGLPVGALITIFTISALRLPGGSSLKIVLILFGALLGAAASDGVFSYPGFNVKTWRTGLVNAQHYNHFIINWLQLLGLTLIAGVFILMKLDPKEISLTWLGSLKPTPLDANQFTVSLIILCGGYTIADYLLNRHFYFAQCKQKSTHL